MFGAGAARAFRCSRGGTSGLAAARVGVAWGWRFLRPHKRCQPPAPDARDRNSAASRRYRSEGLHSRGACVVGEPDVLEAIELPPQVRCSAEEVRGGVPWIDGELRGGPWHQPHQADRPAVLGGAARPQLGAFDDRRTCTQVLAAHTPEQDGRSMGRGFQCPSTVTEETHSYAARNLEYSEVSNRSSSPSPNPH